MIKNLMLIDDNVVDQKVYSRIFERSGLIGTVLSFRRASEAIDYLSSDAAMPELVLLDINMPGMDGFEFLDAAERLLGPSFTSVVVMLTTSLDPKDEARAASHAPVKDFLNKPLTAEHVQRLADLVAAKA